MSATTLIYMVGIGIFSMAFIFMFLILKPANVTKEKLEKIFDKDALEKIYAAEDVEEIKNVIMSLKKGKKIKLKTLAESQNIIDAIKMINEVLLGNKNFATKEKLKKILGENLENVNADTLKKLDKNTRAKLQLLFLSMDDEEIAKKIKELI